MQSLEPNGAKKNEYKLNREKLREIFERVRSGEIKFENFVEIFER
jgi:hypothetical protein